MQLYQLGIKNYEEYKKSQYFEKLRKRVGVAKKYCSRCNKKMVRIPHHLCYECLGEEKKKCVVGVCFDCNHLAHFYDDGAKVLVTRDGYHLQKRWKEINSLWYHVKKVRPSDIISTLWNWYQIK